MRFIFSAGSNMQEKSQSNIFITSEKTPKFILSYGSSFLIDKLPKGTRIIYPPKPLKGIENPAEAIEYALEHPLGKKPLSKQLKKGMKVTIAFDDISLPLPPMKYPDVRRTAMKIIFRKLKQAGIDDVHLIVAIGLHRKITKHEIEEMLGKDIVDEYWPDRLYNHDAENPGGIVYIGKTEKNEKIYINKRVAESDLVIYLNVNFVSMDGGHKSFITGLCDYKSISYHHNHHTLMNSKSYFDPEHSMLHDTIARMGRVVEKKINTFRVETALNNDLFPFYIKFLQKRHYELTLLDKIMMRATSFIMNLLPGNLQRKINSSIRADYKLIAVNAGEVEAVHKKILEANFKQYEVDIDGQSDILIGSIPDISPYSVNSIMNPILFVCLAHGYFFNLYRGKPILKKSGVFICMHPLTDEFHLGHHPSYKDFFENILSRTLDAHEIEMKYEKSFAENPRYKEAYRKGNAYHGVHPFYMWYWGYYGFKYAKKTIVVGAKSRKVLERFGFVYAKNLNEAHRIAKKILKKENPSISYLRAPPIVSVKVK